MSTPTDPTPAAASKRLSDSETDFATNLAAFLDQAPAGAASAPQKVNGLPFGGAVGQVVKALLGNGVGALGIIQWLPLIIELLSSLGSITDVIKQIVDWIRDGKTPKTAV